MLLRTKFLITAGVVLVFAIIIALVAQASYLKFVDSYEIGYKFDALTGKTTILPRTGWFTKKPFVEQINTIDMRPFQVCINANQRVLNCKLVQFNPAGLETFISWHGRRDYVLDFASSSSTTSSSSIATGDFEDIMRSYAYDGSGRSYPFLTVKKELKSDDVQDSSSLSAAPSTSASVSKR